MVPEDRFSQDKDSKDSKSRQSKRMYEPSEYTKRVMAAGDPQLRQIGVGPWEQEHPDQPRPDPAQDPRFDPELLDQGDSRNVMDRYRYWTVEAIKADLDSRGRHSFEVAIENWTHDFNIGSMVRTANAFTASRVHIIGPHKWNRKGSLMTELYQTIDYHPSIDEFVADIRVRDRKESQEAATRGDSQAQPVHTRIIALDIVPGAAPIETYRFPERCVLLFGAEGPGLTQKALDIADDVVYITQYGSVRSLNAGAAAAVSMHVWMMQHG